MLLEQWAYRNRWRRVHPGAKTLVTLAAVASAFLSGQPWFLLALAASLALITIGGARIPWRVYLRVFFTPLSFLLVGTATLAISLQPGQGTWPLVLRLEPSQFPQVALVSGRSLACLSALLFLAFTTPLTECMALWRRARVPQILLDLMTLGYRTVFIFLATIHEMTTAQQARLGYATLKAARRSLGSMIAVLTLQVWQRAAALEMAVLARAGEGSLIFLEPEFAPSRRSFLLAGLASLIMVGGACLIPS